MKQQDEETPQNQTQCFTWFLSFIDYACVSCLLSRPTDDRGSGVEKNLFELSTATSIVLSIRGGMDTGMDCILHFPWCLIYISNQIKIPNQNRYWNLYRNWKLEIDNEIEMDIGIAFLCYSRWWKCQLKLIHSHWLYYCMHSLSIYCI